MGHSFSHAQLEKDKDAAAPTTVKTYIHSKRAAELREWWFVWAKHYCEMLGRSVPDSVSVEVAQSRAYLKDQILSELSNEVGWKKWTPI